MTDENTMASARYIFATGRMIHDHVQRITTRICMNGDKNSRFGDLSAPQLNMLIMVRVRDSVSVTELAALLGVSPPSVSTMVERLVERGLLNRTPCQEDRRKVVIRVSPEAIEALAEVETAVLGSFVEIVEALGPETTRKWCEVLEKIKTVLDKNQPST